MSSSRLEIRQQADGGLTLRGYAATFEQPYDIGGWYEETIAKGAFRRSLNQAPAGPDVSLLVNHGQGGSGLPIARTTAGTLHLSEDDHGLLVNADLDQLDPEVQSLHRKMQRGDLDGQMSFAFKCIEQSWNEARTKRRILAAEIHKGDVSIVNYGANDSTSSTIRSADGGVPLEVRQRRAEMIGKRFVSSPAMLIPAGDRPRWSDPAPRSRIPVPVPDRVTEARLRMMARQAGARTAPKTPKSPSAEWHRRQNDALIAKFRKGNR